MKNDYRKCNHVLYKTIVLSICFISTDGSRKERGSVALRWQAETCGIIPCFDLAHVSKDTSAILVLHFKN